MWLLDKIIYTFNGGVAKPKVPDLKMALQKIEVQEIEIQMIVHETLRKVIDCKEELKGLKTKE